MYEKICLVASSRNDAGGGERGRTEGGGKNEYSLLGNDHSQFGISGGYNFWTLNREANRKIKHFVVMPEVRWWLCERFNGHFFGLHAGYTEYNISNVRIPFRPASSKDHRYQGWGTGVGISYGYSWIIGRRWNLEATVGVGYVYTDYDKYDCVTCGTFRGTNTKHYFGPTKIGISFVYIIK